MCPYRDGFAAPFFMNHILCHIRNNILRGLLAVIPIFLTVFSLFFIHRHLDVTVMRFLDQYYSFRHIPGIGLAVVLIFLLFVGIVVSYWVGRQIFKVIDAFFMSIPVIKQVYALAQQMGSRLSSDDNHNVFKKTVLINYPNAQQWTIGFQTGLLPQPATGKQLMTVYVPYAHPMFGFVYLVDPVQVLDPGWSVEEGLKMVATLGLIAPHRVATA